MSELKIGRVRNVKVKLKQLRDSVKILTKNYSPIILK